MINYDGLKLYEKPVIQIGDPLLCVKKPTNFAAITEGEIYNVTDVRPVGHEYSKQYGTRPCWEIYIQNDNGENVTYIRGQFEVPSFSEEVVDLIEEPPVVEKPNLVKKIAKFFGF